MATEILRPNAAGDETSIESQYPDSGEHWDKVDEETPDENSTYVYPYSVPSSSQRDLYNLPASSIPDGATINFIKIYFRVRVYLADKSAYAKPSLKSNSTVTDGTEIHITSASWTTYSEQWNTNPADGEAWEKADIDALQIGISLENDTHRVFCTQVYVEIDYTPAVTEKASSDAGSGADAVDSLETPEAKSSSDAGSGVEGTPMQSAVLAGSETGFSIEALTSRLLAAVDAGGGVEAGGLLKDLFATEPGVGSDSLIAKIEIPTKGGGMKLWT